MSTAFSSSPNESVPASPRYVPNDSTVDWTAHSPSLLPRAAVEVEAGVGIAPDVERGHGEGRDEVAAVDDGVDALAFEQRDGRPTAARSSWVSETIPMRMASGSQGRPINLAHVRIQQKSPATGNRPTVFGGLISDRVTMVEHTRTLDFKIAFAIGLGTMIAAGIFSLSGTAVAEIGSSAVIAFVLAAIVASLTAASYSEFASIYSENGGGYLFSSRTFEHDTLVYVVGAMLFLGYTGTTAFSTSRRWTSGSSGSSSRSRSTSSLTGAPACSRPCCSGSSTPEGPRRAGPSSRS